MSKEKMLETAQEVKTNTLISDVISNKAKAEDLYVGKIFKVSGYVRNIDSNFCSLDEDDLRVYLEKDILTKLTQGERITVVGKINNIIEKDGFYHFEMNYAYYVDNTFEITGSIENFGTDLNGTAYCKIRDNDTQATVEVHLDKDTLNNLKKGDEITVIGKMTKKSGTLGAGISPYDMVNAQLVEK